MRKQTLSLYFRTAFPPPRNSAPTFPRIPSVGAKVTTKQNLSIFFSPFLFLGCSSAPFPLSHFAIAFKIRELSLNYRNHFHSIPQDSKHAHVNVHKGMTYLLAKQCRALIKSFETNKWRSSIKKITSHHQESVREPAKGWVSIPSQPQYALAPNEFSDNFFRPRGERIMLTIFYPEYTVSLLNLRSLPGQG